MILTVLDTNFNTVTVLDGYRALIWTDRYRGTGNIELYIPVNKKAFDQIQEDYYILNKESEHVMIVENLETETDLETGSYVKITGRSLESIPNRRIIWGLRNATGNFQSVMKSLITDSIINPSIADRKISNFIFVDSTDPRITSLTIDTQYTGDNLGELLEKECEERDIGYKITLNDNNQFVFQFYAGTDRSYENTDGNPYVVFSPKYENLVNSNYYKSKANLKNVTLIGGEGEANDRVYTTYGSASGLQRRELFSDARDLQSKTENGDDIPRSQYISLLQKRGKENLLDYTEIEAFEGEVEATQMFVYKVDFFLGDIVQIANEYGREATTRITELVIAEEEQSGLSIYPTFTILDKD